MDSTLNRKSERPLVNTVLGQMKEKKTERKCLSVSSAIQGRIKAVAIVFNFYHNAD